MAHLFYACLAPPIVVGALLTCQSLDLNRRRPCFFQMYFQEKNTVLYSGQYSKINEALGMFKVLILFKNISYAHQRT